MTETFSSTASVKSGCGWWCLYFRFRFRFLLGSARAHRTAPSCVLECRLFMSCNDPIKPPEGRFISDYTTGPYELVWNDSRYPKRFAHTWPLRHLYEGLIKLLPLSCSRKHRIVYNIFLCYAVVLQFPSTGIKRSKPVPAWHCIKWAPWRQGGSGRTQVSCIEPWPQPYSTPLWMMAVHQVSLSNISVWS